MTQPPNRPIVGEKLYDVESGIIAGWVRLGRNGHPLESIPFAPELVGQKQGMWLARLDLERENILSAHAW